jgi:hypothetical protein
MLNEALTALSAPLVALIVSAVPTAVHVQPEKVATPEALVLTAPKHPARLPFATPFVVRVTDCPDTGLPSESVTVTDGWIGKTPLALVAPLGCTENATVVAAPAVFVSEKVSGEPVSPAEVTVT